MCGCGEDEEGSRDEEGVGIGGQGGDLRAGGGVGLCSCGCGEGGRNERDVHLSCALFIHVLRPLRTGLSVSGRSLRALASGFHSHHNGTESIPSIFIMLTKTKERTFIHLPERSLPIHTSVDTFYEGPVQAG